MRRQKVRRLLLCAFGSFVLAGVLAVTGDFVLACMGVDVRCSLFLAAGALMTAAFFGIFRRKPLLPMKIGCAILGLLTLVGSGLFFGWKDFSKNAAFEQLDYGKAQLYSGRRVMLIVPHQDDDINVLGGVIEEYIRYGSEVYPVFVTNGDISGRAEERFREVMDVCAYIGIPEENVIFLGYGDTWDPDGPHLYNAEPGTVMESAHGKTETYGTMVKDVWAPGTSYTVEHFLGDLRDVILSVRPDVIVCSDYDSHIDHKATTLAVEKVIGGILRADRNYRPVVLKGYAYSTAWHADPDFYGINIRSTVNVFGEGYQQKPAVYRWEDRIRLPVGDYTLSRSLITSPAYHALKLYRSQEAHFQAVKIVNGDKVLWYRDTNSLCYDASISVSSGNAGFLNDFMLLENYCLTDEEHMPYDGAWIPTDELRSAEVEFPEKRDVYMIRLYDNPSPEDNVLGGYILFDDGTRAEFGPLDPNGAAVTILTKKEAVSGFGVFLTKTEGTNAGLTEIEAFAQMPDHGMRYLKLMDADGQFVYDYWIPEGNAAYLKIYCAGITAQDQQLRLTWDNEACQVEFSGEDIRAIVPSGESTVLTVALEGTDLSDTVRIHNPGIVRRTQHTVAQTLEATFLQKYSTGVYRKSATYKLVSTLLG